jgi:hypothetical protein
MSFSVFWAMYPKKDAKKHASMMWDRLTTEQQAKAIETLPAHIKKWQHEARMMQHIPNPGSWINGWRFDDEITAPQQLFHTVNTAVPLPKLTAVPAPEGMAWRRKA